MTLVSDPCYIILRLWSLGYDPFYMILALRCLLDDLCLWSFIYDSSCMNLRVWSFVYDPRSRIVRVWSLVYDRSCMILRIWSFVFDHLCTIRRVWSCVYDHSCMILYVWILTWFLLFYPHFLLLESYPSVCDTLLYVFFFNSSSDFLKPSRIFTLQWYEYSLILSRTWLRYFSYVSRNISNVGTSVPV